ncbi:MAG: hypothetical protein OXU22_02855 [Gammaproteobacteria bacterium]|nr:hypothetical protein [Gammaproteobacteria bacterium]
MTAWRVRDTMANTMPMANPAADDTNIRQKLTHKPDNNCHRYFHGTLKSSVAR